MSLSFKNLCDIGNEPRGWDPEKHEFTIYEEQDDNEVPQPFQDDFEEDMSDEEESYEYCDDTASEVSECERPSTTRKSTRSERKTFGNILLKEDYLPE